MTVARLEPDRLILKNAPTKVMISAMRWPGSFGTEEYGGRPCADRTAKARWHSVYHGHAR